MFQFLKIRFPKLKKEKFDECVKKFEKSLIEQVLAEELDLNNFNKIKLKEGNSWIIQYEQLSKYVCNFDFDKIWNGHPSDFTTIKIMGKDTKTPRWSQNYGQDYFYSGIIHKAKPITIPFFQTLLNFVNFHSLYFKFRKSNEEFKQILVNWYESGDHYIGPHSDSESQLVKNSPIYSFSFGNERDFVVKSKNNNERYVFKMNNCSLLIMGGEMQKFYNHSVPKRKIKSNFTKRINVTFRLFQ